MCVSMLSLCFSSSRKFSRANKNDPTNARNLARKEHDKEHDDDDDDDHDDDDDVDHAENDELPNRERTEDRSHATPYIRAWWVSMCISKLSFSLFFCLSSSQTQGPETHEHEPKQTRTTQPGEKQNDDNADEDEKIKTITKKTERNKLTQPRGKYRRSGKKTRLPVSTPRKSSSICLCPSSLFLSAFHLGKNAWPKTRERDPQNASNPPREKTDRRQ